MSHCASSYWIVKPIVSAYSSVQNVNVKHTDEENPDVSLDFREREPAFFKSKRPFPSGRYALHVSLSLHSSRLTV